MDYLLPIGLLNHMALINDLAEAALREGVIEETLHKIGTQYDGQSLELAKVRTMPHRLGPDLLAKCMCLCSACV